MSPQENLHFLQPSDNSRLTHTHTAPNTVPVVVSNRYDFFVNHSASFTLTQLQSLAVEGLFFSTTPIISSMLYVYSLNKPEQSPSFLTTTSCSKYSFLRPLFKLSSVRNITHTWLFPDVRPLPDPRENSLTKHKQTREIFDSG